MDANTVGAYIAERRRAAGLTQRELAENLHLTNKAVSKWETGHGLPDIDILMVLADILGVTVADILSGGSSHTQALDTWQAHERADARGQKAGRWLIYLSAAFAALGALVFFTLNAERGGFALPGSALTAARRWSFAWETIFPPRPWAPAAICGGITAFWTGLRWTPRNKIRGDVGIAPYAKLELVPFNRPRYCVGRAAPML